MNSKNFAQTICLLISLCFALGSKAQDGQTAGTSGILKNQPFAWMETNEHWNNQKEFSFVFDTPGPNFTAKGIEEEAEKLATRGPVLSRACFGVDDPVACTKDYLQINLQNRYHPSIIFPVAYSGVEYVVFDLDENGKVQGGYHVVQQGTVCEPCAQAAVNEVAKLENGWSPALKNGNTAKSTVVVPVGFHVTAPPKNDEDK